MLQFTKMEGLGNDYVYVNCMDTMPDDLPGLAVRVSDRHFGIGSDGLICICPSDCADVKMRMFNADGSEGAMCGNGIRCVGKFVYDKGLVHDTTVTVETLAGIKTLELTLENGLVSMVRAHMGEPEIFEPVSVSVKGNTYTVYPVSVGSMHAVVYQDNIDNLDLEAIGPDFEHHPVFSRKPNTEFVEVMDRTHLKMRVWETGSGETMACGTGSCAVLVATANLGLCEREVTVHLPGGDLNISWSEEDGQIYMTGPAVTVFEGTMNI